jgi:hypothetical protein
VLVDEGFLAFSTTTLPGFDTSESDIVQMIYRLTVEQKMSAFKIVDYLNPLGIPPKYNPGKLITNFSSDEKSILLLDKFKDNNLGEIVIQWTTFKLKVQRCKLTVPPVSRLDGLGCKRLLINAAKRGFAPDFKQYRNGRSTGIADIKNFA